mmetsp:Transcript_22504/g.57373  ORF Transcript_22504/g.57373 Transcript_22504/m.57373 type:complete len:296 (+) Transcript_22504:1574-2461(+)
MSVMPISFMRPTFCFTRLYQSPLPARQLSQLKPCSKTRLFLSATSTMPLISSSSEPLCMRRCSLLSRSRSSSSSFSSYLLASSCSSASSMSMRLGVLLMSALSLPSLSMHRWRLFLRSMPDFERLEIALAFLGSSSWSTGAKCACALLPAVLLLSIFVRQVTSGSPHLHFAVTWTWPPVLFGKCTERLPPSSHRALPSPSVRCTRTLKSSLPVLAGSVTDSEVQWGNTLGVVMHGTALRPSQSPISGVEPQTKTASPGFVAVHSTWNVNAMVAPSAAMVPRSDRGRAVSEVCHAS